MKNKTVLTADKARMLAKAAIPLLVQEHIDLCLSRIESYALAGHTDCSITPVTSYSQEVCEGLKSLGYNAWIDNGRMINITWHRSE